MTTNTYDVLTQTRLANLVNNFQKSGHSVLAERPLQGRTLKIVLQDRKDGRHCYYAVLDGQPVAYCFGYFHKHKAGKHRFVIGSTFVDPSFQKQNIATELYTAIIDSGITLVSDWELSEGAKRLWAKLQSQLPYKTVIEVRDGYFARKIAA